LEKVGILAISASEILKLHYLKLRGKHKWVQLKIDQAHIRTTQVIPWHSMSHVDWSILCAIQNKLLQMEEPTRLRVSMAIAKLIVTNRQLKTWPCEHHNNARSVYIDWPILAFWLTYLGIMFGILYGVISAAM
jgi:hypothetical protein